MTQLGIPEAQASVYGDRLLQGNYLVMVEGNLDEIQTAEQVLRHQEIQDWGIYSVV